MPQDLIDKTKSEMQALQSAGTGPIEKPAESPAAPPDPVILPRD